MGAGQLQIVPRSLVVYCQQTRACVCAGHDLHLLRGVSQAQKGRSAWLHSV